MGFSKSVMSASGPVELEWTVPHNPTEEEEAIFDYLATYLPADSPITADDAFQRIIDLFPEEPGSEGSKFISPFWELVFCVGSQVDYGQEPMQRYIALLGKLQILPDEIQGGAYPGRNSHVSRMCYVFKFAEQWRRIQTEKNPNPKAARQLQNMNAVGAHMHQNGLDFHASSYALETITKALEDDQISEPYVRAAAVWFIVCPCGIYYHCQDRDCQEKDELYGPLWTGLPQRGYSLSRWAFWQQRFAQIRDQPGVEEETIRICKDALKGIACTSRRGIRTRIVQKCVAFSQKMGC